MRGSKLAALTRKFFLPILVLAFVVAFLFVCRGRVRTGFPEIKPVDGVADARDIDFSQGVYHLVNSWEKYEGLYTPADFQDPVSAPQAQSEPHANVSKGTMRLRILAQPRRYLCLCSFSVDYCTRIFVNGVEVRNIGVVSADPRQAVPKVRYLTLTLYTGESGEIEIIYQYNNYWHRDGGFIQSTQIFTPENIDEYQRGLTLYSLLLSSGLLFLMFYFLLSAAIQKNREYLAPALCCLVIALRNQFFFAEHLLSADYDFYLEYRLVVLDVSLIPASALYLLSAFYRKALRPWSLAVFAAAVAVLIALHPPLVPAGASAGAAVFAPTGSADGVTVGVDETHYGPELDCTCGQIMTFLWRAGGSPEPESTESPFSDVTPEDYYFHCRRF